jgi:hypothetical protein
LHLFYYKILLGKGVKGQGGEADGQFQCETVMFNVAKTDATESEYIFHRLLLP